MAILSRANTFSLRIMTKMEAAYTAGLFDGEGSIFLTARKGTRRRSHHFNPEMTLGNTNLQLIDLLGELTGNGAIYLSQQSGPNHKPLYRWMLQPSQIRHVLPQLLPYLVGKKRQAELMMRFFDLQQKRGVDESQIADVLAIYAELRALNHRGLTEVKTLDFSVGEPKERKRTCDVEGCENRRYRGHMTCYQHWLVTQEPIQNPCEECGESFTAVMQKARFCTPRCQWRNAARRRAGVV